MPLDRRMFLLSSDIFCYVIFYSGFVYEPEPDELVVIFVILVA